MSSVPIVRTQVKLRGAARRRVDERLMIRLAPVTRLVGSLLLARMPPESTIRRRALARLVDIAYDAFNRHDLAFLPAFYYSDTELAFDESFADLGLPGFVRGPEGARKIIEALYEGFTDVRWESPVIFDGGEVAVILMNQVVIGAGSGVRVTEPAGNVYRMERGRLVSHRLFRGWREALRAAGFPEALADEVHAPT